MTPLDVGDRSDIVAVEEMAVAEIISPKAMFVAIAEPFEIFSAVIVGFTSEIVRLLSILVILTVAMVNLLRLVL